MRKHFLAVACGLTLGFVLGRDHGIKLVSQILNKGTKSHCAGFGYYPRKDKEMTHDERDKL